MFQIQKMKDQSLGQIAVDSMEEEMEDRIILKNLMVMLLEAEEELLIFVQVSMIINHA